MNYEKSIFLSDVHVPFCHREALDVVKSFTKEFMPDNVYLLGDICDFYQVSRFDQDPERIFSLQKDLYKARKVLKEIRNTSPDAKIVYLEGNHEQRMQKYLWRHPEIASLDALNVPVLLHLDDMNIEYIGKYQTYKKHNFILTHGEIVRKHSGYTARGMFEQYGMSGISGHTHRLGVHYVSNEAANYLWAENGCLCDLNPEYIVGRPNWLNGFSIGYFQKGNKRFNIEQIPIIEGKAFYAGNTYK